MSDEIRGKLITGLVGPHRELYLTNPWFRTQIDTLALLLPGMIDGLAGQSREAQEQLDRRIKETEQVKPEAYVTTREALERLGIPFPDDRGER